MIRIYPKHIRYKELAALLGMLTYGLNTIHQLANCDRLNCKDCAYRNACISTEKALMFTAATIEKREKEKNYE